jgi:alkanesulfonate monooxygenase
MNSVSHAYPGLWRHPRDRSLDYSDLTYWIEFARLLERGKFDGIFMADGLGVYDVYGGSAEAAIRRAVMIPKNDPSMLVSAMAAATRHLGFGITFSVADEVPYSFARKVSTLDHLTRGRVGWNIVTGFLESSAKAKGDRLMDHDERYVLAEEYMNVVYRLWEESWEEGAVVRDVASGIYADPSKVHRIQHEGTYFKLDAVHMSEPSPQRTPVLYQAGTSAKGVEFAGRHAECVFVNGSKPSSVGGRVKKIRDAAVKYGRRPEDIQALMSMTVVVARTDAEAEAKHREYNQYYDPEGGLVRLSGFIGADLSKIDPNEPIKAGSTNAIQSILENLTASTPGRIVTAADMANSLDRFGSNPVIVGSPKTVVDQLQYWVERADVDGFNLSVPIKMESMTDFVELVIPEMQRRGIYKSDYKAGTLREKLFGEGARTPSSHPSAKLRKH